MITIERMKENISLLKGNIKENGCDNVIIVPENSLEKIDFTIIQLNGAEDEEIVYGWI